MLEIKNTIREMKNAFKCLIIVDTTEETFIELYDNSMETSHTKMKRVRKKNYKQKLEIFLKVT